jgi:hypothetical protein
MTNDDDGTMKVAIVLGGSFRNNMGDKNGWVNHFGPKIAADLRMVYLWRAVDAEGEVLELPKPRTSRGDPCVSPGGHVHRPAPIAMRPLRQKSSRFLSRGALEASQNSRISSSRSVLLLGLDIWRTAATARCCAGRHQP